MPTLFSHALVGALIAREAPLRDSRVRIACVAAGLAVLPDADVIAFALDIPYAHPLGHRGFSHSLLFALLIAPLALRLFLPQIALRSREGLRVALVFALATASHGLLDAMTDAGLGVAFFLPFDDTRYFLPFRGLRTSPIGVAGFLERGGPILQNELQWIVVPCLAGVALLAGLRRFRQA